MDTFFLQLATIFVPGILWARIDATYASRKKPNQFNFLLNSFAFGLISYLLVYLAYIGCGFNFTFPAIGREFDPTALANFFDEILFSLIAALFGSVLWCYIVRFRLFMHILHFLCASKSFGDEDVWEFAFNDEGISSKAVHIRDRDQKLLYSGSVEVFSGSDQKRELILSNVTVFDDISGDELYTAPRMYLAYDDRWLSIDFPLTDAPKGEHDVKK